MQLCTAAPQGVSNLPNRGHRRHNRHLITDSTTNLSSKPSLLHRQIPCSLKSLRLHSRLLLARAATSEETPSGPNPYAAEERGGGGVSLEDVVPPEKNLYNQTWTEEEVKEDANADAGGQMQIFDYFSNLDLKLDSDDTYNLLLYGGGALFALWLASAVVGAIDSIPLFPKLLEVVGLGYTVWFSSRYLIFKCHIKMRVMFDVAEVGDLSSSLCETTCVNVASMIDIIPTV
ncbi:protein CURVATURE THYLAKOID 1D, chloroplastic isoform X1 [Malus sylvestris]|uniref:protein CURVATURE THYLAKOID 1D, chloroplastic isoform X1 n=1 Tax=Malus sylvestris TaxID=3752 RepID=UPI0021ABCD5E|nr:protein CURVATURE THYLAKOID 1D, chloroplastic isoform X1 [Malus sylvestris]